MTRDGALNKQYEVSKTTVIFVGIFLTTVMHNYLYIKQSLKVVILKLVLL